MCSECNTIPGHGWRSWAGLVTALAVAVGLVAGCSPKRAVQVFPPASSRDAIQRARDILSLYAGGQPLGSESIGFDVMIEDVRKIDDANAAILEQGFAEIMARPAVARDVAVRLLERLPASAAATVEPPRPHVP